MRESVCLTLAHFRDFRSLFLGPGKQAGRILDASLFSVFLIFLCSHHSILAVDLALSMRLLLPFGCSPSSFCGILYGL